MSDIDERRPQAVALPTPGTRSGYAPVATIDAITPISAAMTPPKEMSSVLCNESKRSFIPSKRRSTPSKRRSIPSKRRSIPSKRSFHLASQLTDLGLGLSPQGADVGVDLLKSLVDLVVEVVEPVV
jgi:hypothetical protein